jgi:hypothetical protein
MLQIARRTITTHTVRNVEYITNGFGADIKGPTQGTYGSPDGRLLESAGLDHSFAPSLRATLNQRGVAGIDQAINFFSRYDQSRDALMQMLYQNNWSFGGRRGKDAVYEAMRRTFNSIASQVGTNPLINEFRSRILSVVANSQGEDYKFVFAYAGDVTDLLRRLRSLL